MRVWPVRCFCVSLFTVSVSLSFCSSVSVSRPFCFLFLCFPASLLLCSVFFIVFFSRIYALCILESPCAQELSPLTTAKPRRETMCNVKQLEPEQQQEQTTPEQPKNNTQKQMRKPEKHDTLKSRAAPRPEDCNKGFLFFPFAGRRCTLPAWGTATANRTALNSSNMFQQNIQDINRDMFLFAVQS